MNRKEKSANIVIRYALLKKRCVAENEFFDPESKGRFQKRIDEIVKHFVRGLLTLDETMKMIAEV